MTPAEHLADLRARQAMEEQQRLVAQHRIDAIRHDHEWQADQLVLAAHSDSGVLSAVSAWLLGLPPAAGTPLAAVIAQLSGDYSDDEARTSVSGAALRKIEAGWTGLDALGTYADRHGR